MEMHDDSAYNNNNGTNEEKKESERSVNNNNNGQPVVILEQDRFMPIANISRIMKRVLPEHAKLSKESKECIQECVTEFFLFVTSEAAEKCDNEKRKTITGEDLLASMETLGFDNYLLPLRAFLRKYKEATRSERPSSDLEDSSDNHPHIQHDSQHHQQASAAASYASPPPTLEHSYQQAAAAPAYIHQPLTPQNHVVVQPQNNNNVHHQNHQQQPHQQNSIDQYLPSNLRRVNEIYVDTITNQHYIAAESPGGTTGLIPIEIRGLSEIGQAPQPISIQALAQQSRNQMNGNL